MNKIRSRSINTIIFGIFALFTFFKPFPGILFLGLFILYLAFTNVPFILFYIGNSRYSKGNIEGAFKSFEGAYDLPNCPASLKLTYAYLLLKERNLEKARKVFKLVVKSDLNPYDIGRFDLVKALIEWKSGNIEEAISILKEAHETAKSTTTFETLGYLLILHGDYDEALNLCIDGLDYDKGNTVILDNMAEIYYYLGDLNKSREIYDELIEKSPKFIEPYYYYALILVEHNQSDEALKMLEYGLTLKESYLSNIKKSDLQDLINKINFDVEKMANIEVKEIESN